MIPSDFQRYIRSNEFKELLAKVQGAMEQGVGEYFDADDLVDVAEYFHVKGDETMAGKVVDYLLTLFPDNEKGLVFKARTAIMADKIEEAENISKLLGDAEIVDAVYLRAEILLCRENTDEAQRLLVDKCPELPDDSMENVDVEDLGPAFATDDDEEDEESSPSDTFNDYVLDVALLMCDYRQWDYADYWISKVSDEAYYEEGDYLEVKARILTAREQYAEAIDYWNKSIDVDAYSLIAWLQLAQCQYHVGLTHDALQSAEYAEAIQPNLPEVYLSKGNCLFALGDNEGSREAFEHYLKLVPYDVQGEVLLASVLFAMEDYANAESHIQEAIFSLEQEHDDLDGSVPEVVRMEIYRQAAYIAAAQGKDGDAMFYADRLEMCGVAEYKVLLLRGGIKLEQHDMQGAYDYFNQALTKTDNDPQTYIKIGCMFVDASAYEVGYQVLSETKRILSECGVEMDSGFERLAYASLKTDHREEYLEALAKAIETNPTDTMTIFSTHFPKDLPMKEWVEWEKAHPVPPKGRAPSPDPFQGE